jgi:hypothetical protein
VGISHLNRVVGALSGQNEAFRMLHQDTYLRLLFPIEADLPAAELRIRQDHNTLIASVQRGWFQVHPAGTALIVALDGWNRIALAHKTLSWNEDKTPIGEDAYAAPYFLDMGKALIGMLAMDSRSALQSGIVDTFILETLHANGYTEDQTA